MKTPLSAALLFLFTLAPLCAQNVATDSAAPAATAAAAATAPAAASTPAAGAAPQTKEKTALVPFWGIDPGIISQFGEELRLCINKMGVYTPYVVDMKNLPPDVPEGGFPPYVCPSPSLTKDAAYALTGEISFENDQGLWHLRLYLWQMADTRLVFSDELTAVNRAECAQNLPALLEWLFSWLPKDNAPPPPPPPEPVKEREPEKWLYLGLRTGSSLRFYHRDTAAPFVENDVNHYLNLSVAFLACFQFVPWLGLQAEMIFTTDYAPFKSQDRIPAAGGTNIVLEHNVINAQSLMFPLLLKYTYRRERLFAAALAGAYYILPAGETRNDKLGGSFESALTLPLGLCAGVNIGMKLGPGMIFFDIRYAADLGDTVKKDTEDLLYRRSMVSICLGYEMGFFTRKE